MSDSAASQAGGRGRRDPVAPDRLALRARVRGVYAITPDTEDTAALLAATTLVLRGGAQVVQYRNKTASRALRLEQAGALAALCRQRKALFIVNDHLDLALQVAADGLHVGAHDGDLAALRRLLGPGRLLGVSCYDRIDRAEYAVLSGADYIAFGSVFQSRTKPAATRATLALFTQAACLGVPMVGIGGINARNLDALIAAGADAAALISDLYGAHDIRRHAYELARRFRRAAGAHAASDACDAADAANAAGAAGAGGSDRAMPDPSAD